MAHSPTHLSSSMAYSPSPSQGHHHVRLWSSVEYQLQLICGERAIGSPGEAARSALAALQDEEAAMNVLAKIRASPSPIKNLSGFIIYMTRKAGPPQPTLAGESRENNDPALALHPIANANSPRCRAVLNMEVPRDMEEGSPMEIVPDTVTPQLSALGEMEFRKAFLVLSYIGREKLENVPLSLLERLKPLPMAQCEWELWDAFGKDWILPTERRKNLDWDSSKTHVYHCHVNVDGTIKFKGPYLQSNRTHLQRVLGDDNVLLVKFAEENNGDRISHKFDTSRAVYQKIGQEGIVVGLRRYQFFVFKDGGKEEKRKDPMSSAVKCYFVRMESNWAMDNESYILSDKFVHEARAVFMHIHTISNLSKYMVRFSLILSKTTKLDVDLASVHIEDIEDIPCMDDDGSIVYDEHGKPMIHTDGTGFISEDLALKCPRNIVKGNYKVPTDIQRFLQASEALEGASNHRQYRSTSDAPLLIQFRMYNNGRAVKGTLLLNKQLPPNTICIRPSMIKVREDPNLTYIETSNSLEIVTTSNQPRKTYLSRYLISLLHYGGVPEEFFLGLLTNALADASNVKKSKKAAVRVAVRYGDMDDYLVARMILCGIALDEPYLQYRLSILIREEQKSLKAGRLPVTECYYLMGTADPTNTLNANEICVILENGQISGDVLVYKHPGLHFGDIHKLTATYVKDLEKFVGNSKYAIFFPTKRPRSLADEMANSDFDGDMYWVSRNPQLLSSFSGSMPWVRTSEGSFHLRPMETSIGPMEIPCEELEKELFKQFLINRFKPSRTISVAADCWLVFMDRLLTLDDNCVQDKESLSRKILKLVDIYYDALDAPKTGLKVDVPYELQVDKYPHFMERTNSYHSKSILGLIYDKVHSFKMDDVTTNGSVEISKLPCFKDITPSPAANLLWTSRYREYREEMRGVLECQEPKESKDAMVDKIIQKYRQMLYGAEEFENSCRKRDEIFDEVLAIYHITYDYAHGRAVGRCSFAWNVAGRALCMLHAFKQDQERSIICLPSVLEEVFS